MDDRVFRRAVLTSLAIILRMLASQVKVSYALKSAAEGQADCLMRFAKEAE